MKTAVVLLYSLYSPKRIDYQQYLDFINDEIQHKNIEKVILCGGFTNPQRPKDSEAGTARQYLSSVNKTFKNFILEERSINTNQNLEFAKSQISESDELLVYCDLIRKAKIIWIALHYLLNSSQKEILIAFMNFIKDKDIYKDFHYKNLTIIGFDFPGKSKEETIGQTYATILDVLSLYDEEAQKEDIKQRKKDFGLK